MKNIKLLDCTLRDGAYIVNAKFGTPVIKGIMKRMQDARVDIVECGWLKDSEHVSGTTFYHVPDDILEYIPSKCESTVYVAMIDWNRYNLENLPDYNGKTIDAIRVVFPKDHCTEGIALANIIKSKGYKVYLQAANTLAYTKEELIELATRVNKVKPEALSVVDTFGAMYPEDLERIVAILDAVLDEGIGLGIHSHNNQQLSFALSMKFAEVLENTNREVIIDASLCGMGRGAGNATTELVSNFLNKRYHKDYDMNVIMDAIDMYMTFFEEKYKWGYSTPLFIAGMYCTHVNNIAYLLESHRANALDIRNVLDSMEPADRLKYDYDILEDKYLEYQNQKIDDSKAIDELEAEFKNRKVLLVLPGKSVVTKEAKIKEFIKKENPIVIGVNAIINGYDYDYLFFCKTPRYEYAKEVHPQVVEETKKIFTSNVTIQAEEDEKIVNYSLLIKRGWEHFDNAGITMLRLLNRVHASLVYLAGFDGFKNEYDDSFADTKLPHVNPGKTWDALNEEIKSMFVDFVESTNGNMKIEFITESLYEVKND